MGFDRLELSTETLRELTAEELESVNGGIAKVPTGTLTQSPVCPSGATWFASCELTTFCS